ncbi:MAG: type VI secretion system tip protein VgrG [Proteobacteria bacterium]|nr:type VI secretion system tip protein VgrG [Pseudomonadota bacterium]
MPNVGGVSAREGVSYGLREADVPDWAADAIGTVAGMGVHKGLQMGMDQLLGEGGGPTEEVTLTFECDGTPGARWEVGSGTYTEKLNDPYTLWLQLAADNDLDVEPIRMLGQSCLLIIQRGMLVRQVTGIVSEVQEGSTHPQKITTNIVVDPAFEVLRHRVNTKIFQNVTVPQILGEVLNEGLGAFDRTLELRLNRAYPTCEYRTQYNESDLAFCERLMEEEGIVYWFEFADDTPEKLVLSDDPNNYGRVECLQTSLGPSTLLYSEYEDKVGGHEFVSSFHAMSQLRPTKVSTRHFDWTHPSMPFAADANQAGSAEPPNGALVPPEREVYQHDDRPLTFHEYGGGAFGNNDMNDQVRLRREAQGFDSRVAEGQSTALGVTTGQTFDLVGHPQGELDGRYMILSATHSFDGSGNNYQNQFQCIPAAVIYRPKRVTPKPRIPNIQTGTVVGPSGEEIHTDEHGRVKVQFHWDRLGAMDDHSSCWIRVSQPWAGSGWGFFFIPRIGMEVIVSFINGDPDLPLLTGSVYNSEHAPPYPLPDAKTMSTLKTESSLGGGGFNELRFEDMKNSEEVFIHAQKDFNEVVEHDHYTLIHHDQTNEVDNDHTELIHRDQTLVVDRHRSKHIKVNEETKVDGTRTDTVDGDETIRLNSNRRTGIASNDGTNVGATYALTVGSKITIKTGKSSITMKKDGTIDIKGVKITVNGKELIKLQAAQIEEN